MKKLNHNHPFHLVDPSPWPIAGAFAAFFTTLGVRTLYTSI